MLERRKRLIKMEVISLKIPGKPIAKKRPRFARRGNFVKTYNDQETEEGLFLFHVRGQWKGEPKPGAIMLQLTFVMPIPKGVSGKKRLLMNDGAIRHTKKPDLDNMIKFVKDCLNGEAWHDDSQVCFIIADKRYGETPMTLIRIGEIKLC